MHINLHRFILSMTIVATACIFISCGSSSDSSSSSTVENVQDLSSYNFADEDDIESWLSCEVTGHLSGDSGASVSFKAVNHSRHDLKFSLSKAYLDGSEVSTDAWQMTIDSASVINTGVYINEVISDAKVLTLEGVLEPVSSTDSIEEQIDYTIVLNLS